MLRRAPIVAVLVALLLACGSEPSRPTSEAPTAAAPSTAPESDSSTVSSEPVPESSAPPRAVAFGSAVDIQAGKPGTAGEGEPIPAATATAVSDRGTIAVGSERSIVRFADEADEEGEPSFVDDAEHAGAAITALAFVPGTDDLIAADEAGRAVRWTRQGDELWVASDLIVEADEQDVKALAVSPDGSTFATGGADELVRLWNVDGGQPVEGWNPDTANLDAPILALEFSPDWLPDGGGWIGASTARGSAYLVSADGAGEPVSVAPGPVTSLAFTPDGSQLLASGGQSPWLIPTTSGGAGPIEGSPPSSGPVTAVAVWLDSRADDPLVAIAGDTASVGSSRVDLQACKLEYSIVSPK